MTDTQDDSTLPRRSRLGVLWTIAGILVLALGIIGIFLPVLPTTPFVIVAAFCFSKGSPRLRRWLVTHRIFGPMILDWEATGAIPRGVKYMACTMMAGSLLICWLIGLPAKVLIPQAVLMGLGAAYVLTRPDR